MTEPVRRRSAKGPTQPAPGLGRRLEGRLLAVGKRLLRCLTPLLRPSPPDPEREAILAQALARLQALHRVAGRYLPGEEAERWSEETSPEIEESSNERRPKDGQS